MMADKKKPREDPSNGGQNAPPTMPRPTVRPQPECHYCGHRGNLSLRGKKWLCRDGTECRARTAATGLGAYGKPVLHECVEAVAGMRAADKMNQDALRNGHIEGLLEEPVIEPEPDPMTTDWDGEPGPQPEGGE